MFLVTSIILQSQKLKLTDLTAVLAQTREGLVLARNWLSLASARQPQQVWMAPPWHKSCCPSTVSTPTRLAGVQMLEAWQTMLLELHQPQFSPVLNLLTVIRETGRMEILAEGPPSRVPSPDSHEPYMCTPTAIHSSHMFSQTYQAETKICLCQPN